MSLPKMVRTAFSVLLAYSRPPAKVCPARLWAGVGVVKPCTRGVFVGMCMNAPFWAGATLVMVHLDRREVGVVSPRATRAVDGAVLQASFECKGIPACVWDCPRYAKGMHSLVQPLRAHTRLGMAHFNAREVGHSNTSCARYERCHCEHHMTAKGSRHAFGMAKARVPACGAFLRACA